MIAFFSPRSNIKIYLTWQKLLIKSLTIYWYNKLLNYFITLLINTKGKWSETYDECFSSWTFSVTNSNDLLYCSYSPMVMMKLLWLRLCFNELPLNNSEESQQIAKQRDFSQFIFNKGAFSVSPVWFLSLLHWLNTNKLAEYFETDFFPW